MAEVEDKKEIWPGGFPEAKSVEDFDFLMTGKNGGPITKIPKSRLSEVIGVVGESMPAIQGGATAATAVALPAGPTGHNRFFDASWGYWKYNNVVLKNPKGTDGIPEGNDGTLYWNGTSITPTWSISKVQALPIVDTSTLVANNDLGYNQVPIDFLVNRKVDVALSSAGIEIDPAPGYIIASKIPVKEKSHYKLSNLAPVTSAKYIVQYKSNGSIISVASIISGEMDVLTAALCAALSFTVKAPSESVETTPVLKHVDEDKISKIKDAEIIDVKATNTLEKLPVSKIYTLGYILPATALDSTGANKPGEGYAIINKVPLKGDVSYIIGGVRASLNGSKYFSQYNALGAHISTIELKEVPMLIKMNVNTRFGSYSIETPPEKDGYGTKNNYIGEISLFISDIKKSKWDAKLIRTFGDSRTWYDRRTFGATHVQSGQIVIGYQSHMRNILGCIIDNRGESGYDMTQISSVIRGISDYSTVSACTITSGANDSRKGTALGAIAAIGTSFNLNTFYGALQAGIEHILNVNSSCKIYLFTPINGWFKESGTTAVPGPYKGVMYIHPDFVNAIKDVGQLYGLPVLDLYNNSQINKLNKGLYIGDNPDQPYDLHEKNEGYAIEGPIIGDFLNRY